LYTGDKKGALLYFTASLTLLSLQFAIMPGLHFYYLLLLLLAPELLAIMGFLLYTGGTVNPFTPLGTTILAITIALPFLTIRLLWLKDALTLPHLLRQKRNNSKNNSKPS
ncbi:MAG: hypothetical protein ACR2N8_01750, partial [Parvibaculales bacterium]